MSKNGFTILELLIVISVLVVLIGIAIPRFKGMQEQSYILQVKKDVQTLQGAIESYKTFNRDNNPADLSVLLTTSPQIITSALKDPLNGNSDYQYATFDPSSRYYAVYSKGIKGDLIQGCDIDTQGHVCFYHNVGGGLLGLYNASEGLVATNGSYSCLYC